MLENPDASLAMKEVDLGPLNGVDSREFRRLIRAGVRIGLEKAAAVWQ